MSELEFIEAIARIADTKDNFDPAEVAKIGGGGGGGGGGPGHVGALAPGKGPLAGRLKYVIATMHRAISKGGAKKLGTKKGP
jgi:hypothetical protein